MTARIGSCMTVLSQSRSAGDSSGALAAAARPVARASASSSSSRVTCCEPCRVAAHRGLDRRVRTVVQGADLDVELAAISVELDGAQLS
jgi:hypothetical protein